jgi:thioredoxin-related protein
MYKSIIAAGLFFFAGLFGLWEEAVAGQAANGSLKWHSIREYAKLRDGVDRKIYLHFWAEWCGFCRQMEKETFADPAVAAVLRKNFFLIKVNTDKDQRVANAFGVKGLPSNLFLSEDGTEIARREGYIPPKLFMRVLEAIVNAY